MQEQDGVDTADDIIELTETWSLCNDDIYRIANQLLSLAFAVKYFGDDSTRSRVWEACVAFYAELSALGEQLESRPNFNYDCVYQLLQSTLDPSSTSQDNEDVLVEEDKSTLFAICPISRRAITHPVSQRFSYGEDSCDHVFDNASIVELIRSSRSTSVDCPVAGMVF
ncbi:the MIZ type in Nse subunit zinc-finger protein [Babesia ovis]|uniref:The MIZ type in Nse subunit zinc-finger protein n=1 Tax=Babesia ovis TaxID=5869 RepID=A0A9W5TDP2_BABOV|nr:the MIZ type in Nse subunit zinc-finger protein [Babesia ovis]